MLVVLYVHTVTPGVVWECSGGCVAGISNIVGSFVQAYPVTGSFSR